MIALLLAAGLQAATPAPAPGPPPATPDGLPLGAIGKQALPARGCAAFLWTRGPDHRLVAMALADPAQLRLALDGPAADFARSASSGANGYGFAGSTEYRRGDATATLAMTIAPRDDLAGGASVPDAILTIDRAGRDTVVVPVAGMIGCAAQ